MGYCSGYPLYEMPYPQVPGVLRVVRGCLQTEAMICRVAANPRVRVAMRRPGPSRNSFMTGRRPDSTQVWNFIDVSAFSSHPLSLLY